MPTANHYRLFNFNDAQVLVRIEAIDSEVALERGYDTWHVCVVWETWLEGIHFPMRRDYHCHDEAMRQLNSLTDQDALDFKNECAGYAPQAKEYFAGADDR